MYFAGTAGAADPDGLYVINFGGNDLFALASGDTGGLTPPQVIGLLIGNTVSAVQSLSAAGAGKILVTGLPGGGAAGAAIDGQLQNALTAIEPSLSAQLFRFSYNAFFTRFATDPTVYGFGPVVNYTTPCIAARPVVNGNIDCSGFFSFDGTHFTAQVQRGIARDVASILAIPEPASWAMLIVGFGLVGGAMRHTRHAHAAPKIALMP